MLVGRDVPVGFFIWRIAMIITINTTTPERI
jgi:hypothetical protein